MGKENESVSVERPPFSNSSCFYNAGSPLEAAFFF